MQVRPPWRRFVRLCNLESRPLRLQPRHHINTASLESTAKVDAADRDLVIGKKTTPFGRAESSSDLLEWFCRTKTFPRNGAISLRCPS